jgi:HlyD family secretion protein
MKKMIIIAVTVAAVLAGSYFIFKKSPGTGNADIEYETAVISYGNIENSVSATGRIEPLSKVEISTQVSGKIEKIYVDYNDRVRKGQLIAEIDKTNLQSALKDEENALNSAQLDYDYRLKSYNRAKDLFDNKFSSDSDLETAKYNLDNAAVKLERSKLSYEKAKDNLSYAMITSPIDGVVLSVSVEEGQTVAASFSAPTLFTIVNDLTKMQVEADIDEADIGTVKIGQEVEFTIDAYPEDKFSGTVSQIRLEPTTSSNVVTYSVIVDAQNPDSKLLPGMTASLNIFSLKLDNVLVVPAKALSFNPDNDNTSPRHDIKRKPGTGKKDGSKRPARQEGEKQVWVQESGRIIPRPVQLGATDGTNYELVNGLAENDTVILSVKNKTGKDSDNKENQNSERSPFMPNGPGMRRR